MRFFKCFRNDIAQPRVQPTDLFLGRSHPAVASEGILALVYQLAVPSVQQVPRAAKTIFDLAGVFSVVCLRQMPSSLNSHV